MILIEYPKCSTCQKAKRWLQAQGCEFEDRHIVEDAPTAEELTRWAQQAGVPIQKLANTKGRKYKELQLKERLPRMTEEEIASLLASDGMLIKRPLLVTEGQVLYGFEESKWRVAIQFR